MSWETLVRREPRLARLRAAVEAVEDTGGPSFCANKFWYINVAPRLMAIVGPEATRNDPTLRSSEAYEIAYGALYPLLPDCRNCICVPW